MRPLPPQSLTQDTPVDPFDCGNSHLNAWLKHKAHKNQSNGSSRTYVTVDSENGKVLGFYSLSAFSIVRRDAHGWLSRNSPDPIPVILLGQLAVDISAQGLGLGRDLLSDALHRAERASQILGARALVTEPIDRSAAEFYERFGLRQLTHGESALYVAHLSPRLS